MRQCLYFGLLAILAGPGVAQRLSQMEASAMARSIERYGFSSHEILVSTKSSITSNRLQKILRHYTFRSVNETAAKATARSSKGIVYYVFSKPISSRHGIIIDISMRNQWSDGGEGNTIRFYCKIKRGHWTVRKRTVLTWFSEA